LSASPQPLRASAPPAASAAEGGAAGAAAAEAAGAEAEAWALTLGEAQREAVQLRRGWACAAAHGVLSRAWLVRAAPALRRWQLAAAAAAAAVAAGGITSGSDPAGLEELVVSSQREVAQLRPSP